MPKGQKVTQLERKSIVEMYVQKAGDPLEIAAANNLSRQTVYRVLAQAGLYTPRTLSAPRRQRVYQKPPQRGFFSGLIQRFFR